MASIEDAGEEESTMAFVVAILAERNARCATVLRNRIITVSWSLETSSNGGPLTENTIVCGAEDHCLS